MENNPRTSGPVIGTRDLVGSRSMIRCSLIGKWVSGGFTKFGTLGLRRVDECDGTGKKENFGFRFPKCTRKGSEGGGRVGTTKGYTRTYCTVRCTREENP